jgi:hypothetical protein
MSKRIVIIAAAVLIAGIGGYAALLAAKPPADPPRIASPARPVWTQVAWPFPIDEWGGGWAFQCKAADCGVEIDLYLRPKIGFCNCKVGVADDEELDRVSDIGLIADGRSALDPGRAVKGSWMKGRSRGYKVAVPWDARWGSDRSAKSVLSLAFNPFNDTCDVIVATVVAGDRPVAQEQAVLEFLDGDLVRHYAETVLGL